MKKIITALLGDLFVSKYRYLKRKYFQSKQEKDTEEQRTLFYRQFIKEGNLCFDVGANLGNRVAPLLSIGAKVVAVEPQEECYRYLRHIFGNRIVIETKGIGEKEEIKDFYISSAITISSFSADWINSVKDDRFKGSTWDKVVKIEMTTLDRLIAKHGVPHFIKIDVEGYELHVLKGLSIPIEMISFEYTVPEQIVEAIKCIEQIEKNGTNIECNYSIGESMTFASTEWIPPARFKEFINSQDFIKTRFGDIYVRSSAPSAL